MPTLERHRSWSTASNRRTPVSFTLDGELDDGTTWSETFTCAAKMPVKALATFGGDRQGLPWALDFIRTVVVVEDRDRLEALLDDPLRVVEAPIFTEIVTWIIEELSGNPTQPPSSSPSGSSTTGGSSTGPAPSTASTP